MKAKRLVSLIALLLALVMSFTSCGVIDTAKGLIDGSISFDQIFSQEETPEQPDPEQPDPEQPDPEQPDPEQPDPEQPDPEQPDPEQPNPEQPDPEQPDPEQPDPEQPDPEQPNPEQPDPEQPEPEQPDPEQPDPETPPTEEDTSDYPPEGENPTALDSYKPLTSIPEYTGSNFTVINGNMPYYIKAELGRVAYTYYSQLDSLGRAGIAVGCLGPETLPTTDRKDPSYDPTGWIQASYSGSVVTGGQIWNRSHLIAWSLGSDSSKLNLVTGTPYFNQIGMVKFENMVRDYIKETGNHVLYRVVPVFVGDELVCRGVTIEAFSIEDNGGRDTSDESDGICFNVFIHNVNPGINIDYATGKTSLVPGYEPEEPDVENYVFVLNTSSKKIHMPDCSSVTTMSDKNKGYTDKTYEELVAEGYAGCKICHPENHQP